MASPVYLETQHSTSDCAKWIRNQNFETFPTSEKSSPHTAPNSDDSSISDSVFDCIEYNIHAHNKKQTEKWKHFKLYGCHPMQRTPKNKQAESSKSSGPKTKYEEIIALFQKNRNIYEILHFEYVYKFDWNHYSKNNMQYVLFTKVCQSHSPEDFVEMRKEDDKCTACNGSNLAIAVRLTAPLDLSDIPIPSDVDLQIHVSFLAKRLLNHGGNSEYSHIFSNETCERMYNLYRQLLKGKRSSEYAEWFEKCKYFVQPNENRSLKNINDEGLNDIILATTDKDASSKNNRNKTETMLDQTQISNTGTLGSVSQGLCPTQDEFSTGVKQQTETARGPQLKMVDKKKKIETFMESQDEDDTLGCVRSIRNV